MYKEPTKFNPSKFYGDPEWVLIEEILRDCFKSLSYEPDENTSPEDFKAQVLSNKKMIEGIEKFLSQSKVYISEISKKDPWL